MAKPSFLCLDEPTSGLDANSALLVMESLKTLVETRGTTICSVIHQPRKFIYELFDSLILLGVGGKMVYHGPVAGTEQYFKNLGYELPPGESIADWLIDISSGRLEQTDTEEKKRSTGVEPALMPMTEEGSEESSSGDVQHRYQNGNTSGNDDSVDFSSLMPQREGSGRTSRLDNTIQAFEDAPTQEKSRREELYNTWKSHFNSLSEEDKELYTAPEPYDLPGKVERASFSSQLLFQLQRLFIVARRNWLTKLIDTVVIAVGALLISFLSGTLQPTYGKFAFGWGGWVSVHERSELICALLRLDTGGDTRLIDYESVAEPTSVEQLVAEFPKLFAFALEANWADLQG